MHEGFDPDDPAQMPAWKIMDRRWNNFGKAGVKAVIAGPPPVHVHLLMQLHVNGVMIRVS
ncbi:hypothetical protein SAMN06272765_2155 [Streptomyces sp. Ag109_G2-15]|nr:hypothetical protein SAMN06272765_2155 [Streptomyces sp. Ag109_G2-15]